MIDKENGSLAIDWEDEIIKGSLVSQDGQLMNQLAR